MTAVSEAEAHPNPTYRLLMLHQGADLYGSDFIFAEAVGILSQHYRVTVVLDCDGPLRTRLAKIIDDVRIMPLGVLRRSNTTGRRIPITAFTVARATWRLIRLIHDGDFMAVYSNTAAVISGAVAARLCGRRHIWHLHEIMQPGAAAALLMRLGLACSDLVICVSNATREATIGLARPRSDGKIVVVHNGIRPIPSTTSSAPGVWATPKQCRVAMVGRISSWKGQETLAHALLHLSERLRGDMDVIVVGDVYPGNEAIRTHLVEFVRENGLESTVRFLGYRPDAREIMASSSVVVVPSTLPDPFPTVVLEAMSAGVAVIASDAGGIPEMVLDGGTGILFPPGDSRALADALRKLAEDPDLARKLGNAGQRRFDAHFTEEIFRITLARQVSFAARPREDRSPSYAR